MLIRGTCWISLVGDVAFEPVELEEGHRAMRSASNRWITALIC
jgi:hypothetical protein